MGGYYKRGQMPKRKSAFFEVLNFLMKVTKKIRRTQLQMRKLLGEKRNPTVEKEGIEAIVYE